MEGSNKRKVVKSFARAVAILKWSQIVRVYTNMHTHREKEDILIFDKNKNPFSKFDNLGGK